MAKFRCTVCNWVYDEEREGKKFTDLSKEWVCPICGAPASVFVMLAEQTKSEKASEKKDELDILFGIL